MTVSTSELQRFAGALNFPLDRFQVDACTALEAGHGVLVCAPTGAGKTVIGEFAVHLALSAGRKCFYTTPIKALSNQKFADLTARYGRESVGLLTGDSSINPDAPVVVMTTEVLRNMLYASSDALRGLSHVVMDEVHYLADRFRGAVWEEVILHLSQDVRLVSLSATVSNAEEFGAWMETVRGDTTVVVDENRPVPLSQHIMVGRRLFDLFDSRANADGASKVVVDKELVRHVKQRQALDHVDRWQAPHSRGRGRSGGGGSYSGSVNNRPLPRPEVIARLDQEGLLPAITFIFSRAGCDAALTQCLRSRLALTTPDQAEEIRYIVDKHTSELPRQDLEVLGFWEWREALERGLAAHHAGMLPVFRHTVEELFVKGLVRAVFATETLALGINMPARTVVLEKLVKYNGETHAELTPGEYTQLTGRAGRRGIDVEGHAVVLWQPGTEPTEVAGLASTRTFPLRSSFRPGYNMSINLVEQFGAADSRALLERSFAQFQADRSVVGLVRGIERNETTLAQLGSKLGGPEGEYFEYASLRERLKAREKTLERQGRQDRRDKAVESLRALKRGDVVSIPSGRRSGLAVVLEPDDDRGDPRPLFLTEDKWAGRLSAADFPSPADPLGRMRLPRHVDHRTARTRRDLAAALRSTGITAGSDRRRRKSTAADDRELATLRRSIRSHPVHSRPDRDELGRVGERYNRIARETETMRQKVSATTNSLARTFDRILALLAERDYITTGKSPTVTENGSRLGRIYSESDLLVAECLRQGLWRGLSPAELAAVVSAVVYESRQEGDPIPHGPTGPIRFALGETVRVWTELHADEVRHKLPPTREPDMGFVKAVYRWASDNSLVDALLAAGDHGKALSGGDFVRWCRQVIDLLDQVRLAAPDPELSKTAARAISALRRGVVAVDAA
ncbi:DEAD/DEAH box helicase [Rhodococcus sp. BP-252]|uniref:DEAD/DEAH box helicase n=1 Tax=unclassified Rhodococcus (in: high G+C Gram-positive bacteria) TaxID=192944 RepID=UPI001C9A5D6E|nr:MULTISPECIES: DEAD/DEAH box helicase [unclassified Rhodococcus (in: high G+C Gram-positive bacteria)]MBY6410076.1 DEAD/DEAH box helicase [Rhodococcus sp. BP-320]MBY6415045.1 DEAD/DEAH box helicase [Rhodococcus sp. BP-321]MBY6421252.1 DEAD/DEAH box helicase [Rhodococcus sp. BP-324]MBY6425647.1 DEAD/DEAH box helicase [Rhodococcus sp. BP-323]MBY6429941.1 DEAD/DEAH box helicase [Rhodococcus sp. BP-322]